MLWLAIHLPLLPLEAFCETLPEALRARPVALVAEHRVVQVNAIAAARGVKPGMKRATALALAGDVLLGEADPRREAAGLLATAHAALAFTPLVSLEGEGDRACVLLEVQSCLRLFGGLSALWARLLEALAPLGHRLQTAAAPTAIGAALLARWTPDERAASRLPDESNDLTDGPHLRQPRAFEKLLDAVPVWRLGPGREHWEALQGMGLQDLSDLRSLPRTGLARRFGEEFLEDLDRAYGRRADPRQWVELPAVFDSRLELYTQAENADQVLAGAAVLLGRLVAWAQARCVRIAAFTVAMKHEPRHGAEMPATRLRIEMASPALAPAHLQTLLRERLTRVVLAAPTLELRLRCREVVAAAAPNGELFPTRQSENEGLTRLLERLRARLGDEQVHHVVPVADHRPERASRRVVAESARAKVDAVPRPLPMIAAHRPVFLLPEPLPLRERDRLPLLEGRVLELLSGPERIESGWWDGGLAARDYYIAADHDGSLVWLWRARLPTADGQLPWFLQGRFA